MDTHQPALKTTSKVALAGLFILFVLSVVYFKERVLFADAAYIAFNIINSSDFAIQFNRYGSFFPQIFPVLGAKMHLPVTTILAGYSIGFYLLYFSVLLLLFYRYKQYGLAILMGLFYFLFFSESFIWISEIPQGIAWMFLLFGTTFYHGKRKTNILVLSAVFLVLAFLAVVTHFVILIPVIYLWVYFLIEKKNWPFSKSMSVFFTCLLFGIIALKFLFALTKNTADTPVIYNATHFSIQDIIDCFSTPVIQLFFSRCLTNYWWAIIIFILGMVSLIMDKQRILALWTFLFVVGYFSVMGLTYGSYDSSLRLFHIESEWTCIGIIVATPFVFSFLPKLKSSVATVLLAGIILTRLLYIAYYIPPFHARNEYKEQILAQMRKKGIKKLVLFPTDDSRSRFNLDWAVPHESILMSAMDGDKPLLTFCFVPKEYTSTLEKFEEPRGYWNSYGMTSYDDLNHSYYNIDTATRYQIMSVEDLFK